MRKDVLVYISGPITQGNGQSEEQNIDDGIQIFKQLLLKGIPAFLPHLCVNDGLLTPQITYQTWIEYDLAVINRCTHLLMMP